MRDFMQESKELARLIHESGHITFFTGAGVSCASGIPDFRGGNGLYDQTGNNISPEEILSRDFFYRNPLVFYAFYRSSMVYPKASPNMTHKAIAILEQMGKVNAVITQNIDGLHDKAGSQNVLELHGSIHRNHCTRCFTFYDLQEVMNTTGIARCPKCGGVIKPDVVLYGEQLDGVVVKKAIQALTTSDLVCVMGSSLLVEPAASLLNYYPGKKLVIINLQPTFYDSRACLVIHQPCEKVMEEVMEDLKQYE
jgi:NAD-dependent deacetylase